MTHTPANPNGALLKPANDNTPAPYDAAILGYAPFIWRAAKRWCRKHGGEAEDYVQDVYVLAFANQHIYNPQFSYSTWLRLLVREVSRHRFSKRNAQKRTAVVVSLTPKHERVEPARQEDYAELSQALAHLTTGPLLRHAMGNTWEEIGSELGVTKQRAHQKAGQERARLMKALAANDNSKSRKVA